MNWLLVRPIPPFSGMQKIQTPEKTFLRSRDRIRKSGLYWVLLDTDTLFVYLFIGERIFRDSPICYVREDIIK